MTDTPDPWGPYRATIEDHLDTCADYLSRLCCSLAGEIAPDRQYFADKAYQLHIAAHRMVRIVHDVDGWLGECGVALEHDDTDGTRFTAECPCPPSRGSPRRLPPAAFWSPHHPRPARPGRCGRTARPALRLDLAGSRPRSHRRARHDRQQPRRAGGPGGQPRHHPPPNNPTRRRCARSRRQFPRATPSRRFRNDPPSMPTDPPPSVEL